MFLSHHVIRIVARPKLDMPGEHWGVEIFPDVVMHLTLEGLQTDSLQSFLAGHTLREVRSAVPGTQNAIQWRVHAARVNPPTYHLVDRNCEVFANWLWVSRPRAPKSKASRYCSWSVQCW